MTHTLEKVSIERFLELASKLPVIDVRSPAEYQKGRVCGAHSLALFNDIERAKVGTCYKQKGQEEAIQLGLSFVGKKLKQFYIKASEICKNSSSKKTLLVYCWRGGMRSENMASYLYGLRFNVYVLTGGYKAYRNYILAYLDAIKLDFKVLGGYTGSGKTRVLHLLKDQGCQVLDLEDIAQHYGSAFGNLDNKMQPSQESFENQLFSVLSGFDHEKPVWVEDESNLVGRCHITKSIWQSMRNAKVYRLELPIYERVKYLVEEYGRYSEEQLLLGINKIRKRLGGLRTKQAIEAVQSQNLETAIEIVLAYYDKSYDYGFNKRDNLVLETYNFSFKNLDKLVERLLS